MKDFFLIFFFCCLMIATDARHVNFILSSFCMTECMCSLCLCVWERESVCVCMCVISCTLSNWCFWEFHFVFLPCLCFDVIHFSIWDTKQPMGCCHRPVCVCVCVICIYVWGRHLSVSYDKLDLSPWWQTRLSFLFFGWNWWGHQVCLCLMWHVFFVCNCANILYSMCVQFVCIATACVNGQGEAEHIVT